MRVSETDYISASYAEDTLGSTPATRNLNKVGGLKNSHPLKSEWYAVSEFRAVC